MSIQFKMGIMLIVVTTATLCGFGVWQYQKLKSERMGWLAEISDRVTDRLVENLVLPIWDVDETKAEKIIHSEMANRNIAAICVRDHKGRPYVGTQRGADWEIVPLSDTISSEEYIATGRDIVKDGEKLGSLELFVTQKFVLEELKKCLLDVAVTVIILDVILFFSLSFCLGRMIVRPVNQILGTAAAISTGDFTREVTIRQKDEIGMLADAFRTILDSMRETAETAEAVAAGNLELEVVERSEKDRMMQALNRMLHRLRQIMDETDGMIREVADGQLDARGHAELFEGGWRDLVSGVNSLIDGFSDAVSKSAALSHEMELARKIQTSLLPSLTDDMHPDLEIAAAMIAADEVGGDFYDVSYDLDNRIWFAIGDVSGHGVTPGLIMMMAQTVHATVTANLDCEARDVVTRVNEILYQNVNERLCESHFMTFTALRYLDEGRFQHAGAHLSMIVFRQKTGICELIRTKGIYLNFKKDISRATKNSEFVLDPGDTLVLYTDGLTEAENADGQMIDIDGLVKIVAKHAHQDPEAMKEMILADVTKWCDNKRADDMTLMIVRRRV